MSSQDSRPSRTPELCERASQAVEDLDAWHNEYSRRHPIADLQSSQTILWGLPEDIETGHRPFAVSDTYTTALSGISEVSLGSGRRNLSLALSTYRREETPRSTFLQGQCINTMRYTISTKDGVVTDIVRFVIHGSDHFERSPEITEETIRIFEGAVEILEEISPSDTTDTEP